MRRPSFGALALSVIAPLALQSNAIAAEKKNDTKKKAPAKAAEVSGKCVHNCAGYAACKGNGNNSCKGQNGCGNEGLVPPECSTQKAETACNAVVDKKQEKMCVWYPG